MKVTEDTRWIIDLKRSGRLLAALKLSQFMKREMISLDAQVDVYRLKNDYALYVVTSDGVDTGGV